MEQTGYRVAVLYTAGRYENVFCRNMIEKALHEVGLRLTVSQGVFYGQCMQMMMEELVGQCDIIITLDGDSLFTGKEIMALLSTLTNHPEIDAIAPLQARRGAGEALVTGVGAGDATVDLDVPVKVRTAHFGLTAIRAAKLVDMPKPWFWSKPSDDGTWKRMTNKMDDDIYFWRKWEEHGNTLFVHPGIAIGHLEEMVATWKVADGRLMVEHVYPADWRQANGY